ncbi:hypothetical protein F4811DRAFT_466145 [Daldinia bambusicola]|nr:hypothetical protein F4811DRAFT_466145 [Daldinia bambusicola]
MHPVFVSLHYLPSFQGGLSLTLLNTIIYVRLPGLDPMYPDDMYTVLVASLSIEYDGIIVCYGQFARWRSITMDEARQPLDVVMVKCCSDFRAQNTGLLPNYSQISLFGESMKTPVYFTLWLPLSVDENTSPRLNLVVPGDYFRGYRIVLERHVH